MAAWTCELCSYVYDEEKESVKWADLPEEWVCPICGSPKSSFVPVEPVADLCTTHSEISNHVGIEHV